MGKKFPTGLAHSYNKVSVSYSSPHSSPGEGRFKVESLLPVPYMGSESLISHVKMCKTTVHIAEQFIVMIRNMIRQNLIGLQTDSEWQISLENAIKDFSATSNTIYYWVNAGVNKDLRTDKRESLWIFIVISNDQVTNTPAFAIVEWRLGYHGYNTFKIFNYDDYKNVLLHMSLLFAAGKIIDVIQTGYFLTEETED